MAGQHPLLNTAPRQPSARPARPSPGAMAATLPYRQRCVNSKPTEIPHCLFLQVAGFHRLPEPSTALQASRPLPPQIPPAGAFLQLLPASPGHSYDAAARCISPKASPGLSPSAAVPEHALASSSSREVCTREAF